MSNSFEKTFKYKEHEIPSAIDRNTGEVREMLSRPNNIPEGKEIWLKKGKFQKDYSKSWDYLSKVLSPLEFRAAHRLAQMASFGNNSLDPINDNTPHIQLADDLILTKNMIRKVLERLFYYGVYGKFEVVDPTKDYTKYWVINPYLSFKGELLESDIAKLFEGTRIARAYRNEYIE